MRLVSVLWGKTWHRYLTNVLDDEQLSAEEVCELYRRRWKIEEAFLLDINFKLFSLYNALSATIILSKSICLEYSTKM